MTNVSSLFHAVVPGWETDVLCCVTSDFKDRFKVQYESSGRESISGVGKNVHISQMKLMKIEVRDSRNI